MGQGGAPKDKNNSAQPPVTGEDRARDDSWVDRLYRDHFREILGFVMQKVGNGPPDPEDMAQQAFIQIAKHKAPETIKNKRAYLYRSAANAIISFRRREAVERRFAQHDLGVQKIFGEGDGLSPERVLLDREQIELVVSAIERLPRRRRRLLLLNRVEGLSYAALARRYGISEKNIRVQVSKALAALAEYAPSYDGKDDETD